jgi:hypothetical protein
MRSRADASRPFFSALAISVRPDRQSRLAARMLEEMRAAPLPRVGGCES